MSEDQRESAKTASHNEWMLSVGKKRHIYKEKCEDTDTGADVVELLIQLGSETSIRGDVPTPLRTRETEAYYTVSLVDQEVTIDNDVSTKQQKCLELASDGRFTPLTLA